MALGEAKGIIEVGAVEVSIAKFEPNAQGNEFTQVRSGDDLTMKGGLKRGEAGSGLDQLVFPHMELSSLPSLLQ